MESLFTLDREGFRPTQQARGGWTAEHVHGAPICALLAHALESAADDPAFFLARMTADLFRVVPHGPPLATSLTVVRSGKRIKVVDVSILVEGEVVSRASGMFLRKGPVPSSVTLPVHPPIRHFDTLGSRYWLEEAPDGLLHYNRLLEVRYATGRYTGRPAAAWVRCPFLFLPGQPLTQFERVAIQSEFVNGVGMSSRDSNQTFVNGDLTLYIHRPMAGEWLCVENVARADTNGVAATNCNLHDSVGYVGHVAAGSIGNEPRTDPEAFNFRQDNPTPL